jgi:hypothetical protein
MDALYYILSWGSPVGLGLFFLLSAAGAGLFFWGLSKFVESSNANKKSH